MLPLETADVADAAQAGGAVVFVHLETDIH